VNQLRFREGDFIETSEGLIFDVKGMVHPPDRVIAYLRYFPSESGSRERLGVRYQKVYDLSARAKLLRKRWPQYLYRDPIFNRQFQAVPLGDITKHYLPTDKLTQLRRAKGPDNLQQAAIDLTGILAKEARVPVSKIGVSGSILVDLHRSKSDLDIVLYGASIARKCYRGLQRLLSARSDGFHPYTKKELYSLYVQRKQRASMPFEAFVRHERPKLLQGKFTGIDYFIRCVREWDECKEDYGDKRYQPAGRATVRAMIGDDTDSIFTPCSYRLINLESSRRRPEPSQIVSLRGRFCEQAHKHERVRARGTLERVVDGRRAESRLIIGEHPRDYLMVVG